MRRLRSHLLQNCQFMSLAYILSHSPVADPEVDEPPKVAVAEAEVLPVRLVEAALVADAAK